MYTLRSYLANRLRRNERFKNRGLRRYSNPVYGYTRVLHRRGTRKRRRPKSFRNY